MSYFRRGDPEDDFDHLDLEEAMYHARLPICEKCKNTIEEEDYYEIDGEILCEDCMKEKYGRSCRDYAEANQ